MVQERAVLEPSRMRERLERLPERMQTTRDALNTHRADAAVGYHLVAQPAAYTSKIKPEIALKMLKVDQPHLVKGPHPIPEEALLAAINRARENQRPAFKPLSRTQLFIGVTAALRRPQLREVA